ncbi:HAD superfamily hydrolase (TIGR01493 family)/HAD superfamily hydrolase (TIGR01509 family)/HAD superfamily hydrolase (TIGR01549 family) [Mycobacterium sp. BK086]|uniref:HAD family hydrolase n=1 Tax=Mycobacterium sp. BK086 TaxID=2512165 RepID=UPI00105BA58B|nr:HAD-IA family hydrolase [Mycobacterium sp. BK086]TDO08117.1 HAD superfamily hydrolase (TIGR01493 family)/HAD superfamily hydrolase (TIGR01509 family)/HAD superfamily hydrolase (TIGR01549 family) [Mycobacterium sp. BK086]
MPVRAVLFDFSGTLFRLEEDDSWFAGMELIDEDGRRAVDEHAQAELMERLTHPTGGSVTRTEEAHRAWVNRDLAPALHREAYLHALRDAGLPDDHAESLYGQAIDPASWVAYPDTVEVLRSLKANGLRTAIVSNIAFDIRPAFRAAGADADEFVLSFEVGVVKPDPRIFHMALERLDVTAEQAVMVGDSDENDGAARAIGCGFILVDPLPVAERPTGLIDPLRDRGLLL